MICLYRLHLSITGIQYGKIAGGKRVIRRILCDQTAGARTENIIQKHPDIIRRFANGLIPLAEFFRLFGVRRGLFSELTDPVICFLFRILFLIGAVSALSGLVRRRL